MNNTQRTIIDKESKKRRKLEEKIQKNLYFHIAVKIYSKIIFHSVTAVWFILYIFTTIFTTSWTILLLYKSASISKFFIFYLNSSGNASKCLVSPPFTTFFLLTSPAQPLVGPPHSLEHFPTPQPVPLLPFLHHASTFEFSKIDPQ